MGMAASQARYLALVARQTNCEYEGQQINQARTALSNQSANLFNQMLGLSVPVPPNTQDFTKIQYSYTDGLNASTIDSWQQLATPEEDYNYVVTSHYYTDVYTGSEKKLSDPQVQLNNNTATKEEKSKYNAKKLCRVVGAGMSVITLLIFVMGIGMDVIPYYFAYVTLAIVLIDCVVMLILMNTICKK